MAETIKYVSLENLSVYHELQKNYIDSSVAKTLKTVALSSDGKKLLFYTVPEPVGSTAPAFEIELPETDVSGLMSKVVNAVNGNIAVFENGSVKDSGTAITDVATKTYVDTKVAQGVAGASALTKKIVTTVPTAAEAVENTIYLLKVESATGADKYEEYTLINGEVVMIGDTSTDLSNYDTSAQVSTKIATAKTEAINAAATDATTKANTALADSKSYTDAEIGKVNTKVTGNTTAIGELTTKTTSHDTTLNAHTDRIAALEQNVSNISTATEEDIRNLFA